MLDADRLQAALNQIAVVQYPERHVFRCVELAALIGDGTRPVQPLYDLGPRQSGQRYTPIGGALALYVAEHFSTSYIETTGMFFSVAAIAQQPAPAEVTPQLRVALESILDITTAANQAILHTNDIELKRNWEWPMAMGRPVPTQILGEAAFKSGKFQAIRFACAKVTNESNLLIWTENPGAGSTNTRQVHIQTDS